MIYNLRLYLSEKLNFKIFAEEFSTNEPGALLQVITTNALPFSPVHYPLITTIRVVTRDSSRLVAEKQAYEIFNELKKFISLKLPATSVDGIIYDAVHLKFIQIQSAPSLLNGVDETGNHFYAFNTIVKA